MEQFFQGSILILILIFLTACGSDSDSDNRDDPDFDMRGIWAINLDFGNGYARSFAIDITTQESGNFNGSGGAYLVDGVVDGNDVSMSIHTGAPIDCGYFTQTYTEEFEFDVATVQKDEISTSADWITSCRLLGAEIRISRL